MERPSHPTPKGIARGEQRLRRIQSMVDEGVVQKLGRARVHTTKRVEGKRNEAKLVLVADLLVRLDVVVVEQLKGRHRASLSTRLVINTKRIGRITNGHIQNIRDPSLVSDNEVDRLLVGPPYSSVLNENSYEDWTSFRPLEYT